MRKIKQNSGFTLTELLITITIIGILTVLGTRQFGDAVKKSKATADMSNAQSLALAVTQVLVDRTISVSAITDEKLSAGAITSPADNTVAKALLDGRYYTTIPQVKGFEGYSWYINIPETSKYAVEIFVDVSSGKTANAIKLYPREASYENLYNLAD